MSSLLTKESDELTTSTELYDEEQVNGQVRSLLAGLNRKRPSSERRREQRFPYPYLLQLTPVAADSHDVLEDSITVVGKNLSVRGIWFYHQQPLPYRRVILKLEDAAGHQTSLLVELFCCRFTRHGWYESGGRFLEMICQHDAEAEIDSP